MRHHLHPFTSIYWFHPTFVLQKFGCALGLHHQRVPVEPVWPASIWLRHAQNYVSLVVYQDRQGRGLSGKSDVYYDISTKLKDVLVSAGFANQTPIPD